MSNTEDRQQAVGNGYAQKHKRHSSGEHAMLQTKLRAVDSVEVRRRSSPALQSQHISLNPKHKAMAPASKPPPPPHPSMSPELVKLISKYKSRATKDNVIVIDSRSKNAPQACTSHIPPKSGKYPPKRPASPMPPPPAPASAAQAPDLPPNPPEPRPPTPTPPPPTPSPPLPTTNPVKSKRVPARPAPPPPTDKASSKSKATSVHKSSEKASSSNKAKPAVLKKISLDSKIGLILEQFEKGCSNNKVVPVSMPLNSAATKPQSSAIPKSQSTDILSPEKTTFPKSQSSDLLSPTSSTTPKSHSTDILKPQIPKSQSSTVLKPQKSIIPKSRSSAVLKSQKSSLPKQDTSTSKQDLPTSKPPSKNWKPKNSKLQALFHKAERRKRKKTKKEKKVSVAQETKSAEEEPHAEENPRPIEAIYAVVQKIHLDDSLTPQTAALYYNTRVDESSQTPGCWIPQKEGLSMATSKNPDCKDDLDNTRKSSMDNVSKLSAGREETRYSTSEDLYTVVQKKNFKAQEEEEKLPPIPPRFYENVFDDPSIAEHGDRVKNSCDMESGTDHGLKAQIQESMDNTYAVMHNPRNKGKGDIDVAESSEQEEPPPLPPRLYENIFDDPIIAEHDDRVRNRGHSVEREAAWNIRPNETAKHASKAQLQESMDNTYAVMHNPHNKDKGESAKSSEQEQPPPIPPKLYENIFDDPIIAEHNGDVAKSSEEEELPPPLPPKLYENVFDDPAGSTEHSNGVKNDHDVERGATQTDQAASQAQLQESADNTYAVMHNPRSGKGKGESTKSSEQEDIYIVMHPHPAFMPLIKKYFKNPKKK